MRQPSLPTARHILATAGLLALFTAAPARADLTIQLSTDGKNWTTVADQPSGSSASYSTPSNTPFSGFNISFLSDDSNSPGTATLSYLEGASVHVNNTGAAGTLYIKLSDTGFGQPVTSVDAITLDSQIGGSVTVGGADNNITYQSYVDPNNGQATLTGFTPGPQQPNITGNPKSYSSDSSMLITSGLTGPFSITESFQIYLDSGSQIGFQSSTNLMSVPEPSSLVILGLGALGFVAYASRRPRAATTCTRNTGLSALS